MKTLVVAAVMALAGGPVLANQAPNSARVDVVFCIDRSGSMQQVIDTAKQKVWGIVAQIAKSKPVPVLRIGLVGYGSADREFKFFPLTDDLDKVYENLMTFRTDMGGEEWVGAAARKAADEMLWAQEKGALKIIFMVGNETAAQGRPELLYTKTIPEIIRKDIMVNAIYCGKPSPEELRTWQEVAGLADGQFTRIDLSGGAVTIETPMDKEIIELNQKLNGTYVPFGREGEKGRENQALQDRNSTESGGAPTLAARASAKAGSLYSNGRWDLVDACKEKDFKLESVKVGDLPQEMQAMTPEQREAHVAKMQKDREAVQKQVVEAAKKRDEYIAHEIKTRGLTQDKAFDEAVRKAIREQGAKKGFTYPE